MEILKSHKTPKNFKPKFSGRMSPEGRAIRELAIGETLPIRCSGDERRKLAYIALQASSRSREYLIRTQYKDGILYIAKFARDNGTT